MKKTTFLLIPIASITIIIWMFITKESEKGILTSYNDEKVVKIEQKYIENTNVTQPSIAGSSVEIVTSSKPTKKIEIIKKDQQTKKEVVQPIIEKPVDKIPEPIIEPTPIIQPIIQPIITPEPIPQPQQSNPVINPPKIEPKESQEDKKQRCIKEADKAQEDSKNTTNNKIVDVTVSSDFKIEDILINNEYIDNFIKEVQNDKIKIRERIINFNTLTENIKISDTEFKMFSCAELLEDSSIDVNKSKCTNLQNMINILKDNLSSDIQNIENLKSGAQNNLNSIHNDTYNSCISK